jgi:hypothetical protein
MAITKLILNNKEYDLGQCNADWTILNTDGSTNETTISLSSLKDDNEEDK